MILFNDDGSVRLESPVLRVPDITPDGRDALEIVMDAARRHFGEASNPRGKGDA